MDITNKTKTELKAIAYDIILQIEQLKRNLAVVEQEIIKPEEIEKEIEKE